MENISLVTWVDTFIQDEINSLERKHLTDLVNIHEMGHTYFGDLLVIRHFEHAWLKESWATYIESCKYILAVRKKVVNGTCFIEQCTFHN